MTDYISTIPTNAADGGDAILQNIIHERLGKTGYAPVVAAVTGLLARVAFADRRFDPSEHRRIRQELQALGELTEEDVDVICDVLSTHIESIGVGPTAGYSEVLCRSVDAATRTTMLKLLVELAEADGHLFKFEVGVVLRVAEELKIDKAVADKMLGQAEKRLAEPPS